MRFTATIEKNGERSETIFDVDESAKAPVIWKVASNLAQDRQANVLYVTQNTGRWIK